MKYIANNLDDIQKIADEFVKSLSPKSVGATVVGLYGNLGAGKTSFTQGVAKAFGVGETVTSPTFVIEKIYELTHPSTSSGQEKFAHLIHIDAYRLEKSGELLNLGFEKIISDKNNLILIEWPEKVVDIMPEHIKIYLKPLENEGAREIEVVV